MEMTSRMKQIMQVLLQESGAVSVKYLAEQIGVSRRTVQRELESIDTSLRGYDLTFVSKTGVGIRIDDYDVSNREERRKRLILEILKEKGLRKLYYYSSKFAVSEATVSADLEAVEGWLARYGLFVGRKPGSGISIEGSEENYRRAIRGFIDENIDTKIMQEVYGVDGYDFSSYQILKKSSIGQILNDDIVSRVIDIVSRFGHNKVLTLTENSYVGLIIHISIAINRIKKNEVI